MTDERTKEQKAFDAHLDELAMNHEFKPRPDSFKREMVAFEEIHRFMFAKMYVAIGTTKNGYSGSLFSIEEELTPAEFITLETFYNWIERGEEDCPECLGLGYIPKKLDGNFGDNCDNCTDGKINNRHFSRNNYNERYKEWLLTLPRIELQKHNK